MLSASAHLTDRDRLLVRLVATHRVLTTDQLAALGFASITTARHRLAVLVRIGMLRRFRPHPPKGSAPWHYVLGLVGAAMLGVEDRDQTRWAPQVRTDRQLGLERSPRLSHMTGRNWFFAALARHAREHGGELAEWLNEADTAARAETAAVWADDRLRLPHPDGAGTWAEDGQTVSFLLEYDAGTEHLPVLAAKLDGYRVLAAGLAWHGEPCPVLLFCFGAPRREQAARRALAATSEGPGCGSRRRRSTPALPARPGRSGSRCPARTAVRYGWPAWSRRCPTRGRTTGNGKHANAARQPAASRPSATPAPTTASPALPGRRSGSGRHLAGRGNPLTPAI